MLRDVFTPPADDGLKDARPRLLSAASASRYLSMPQATLAKLRWEGSGPPFVKIGKRVFYEPEAIDEWIAARVRTSTSDPGEVA